MPKTLRGKIASWEDDFASSELYLEKDTEIATESQPVESPKWKQCIESLLKILHDGCNNNVDCPPNCEAIIAAIKWLIVLRKYNPSQPPTRITPEPGGGVIVEWRMRGPHGDDCVFELTFYNDGSAEQTDYVNGKVLQMNPIPGCPQSERG